MCSYRLNISVQTVHLTAQYGRVGAAVGADHGKGRTHRFFVFLEERSVQTHSGHMTTLTQRKFVPVKLLGGDGPVSRDRMSNDSQDSQDSVCLGDHPCPRGRTQQGWPRVMRWRKHSFLGLPVKMSQVEGTVHLLAVIDKPRVWTRTPTLASGLGCRPLSRRQAHTLL